MPRTQLCRSWLAATKKTLLAPGHYSNSWVRPLSCRVVLVRVNHRFLLGQAVDPEIVGDINKILLSRRSIDSIGSVQSQWTGPETFSYKAEVDFDGTYLAATLMNFYQQEFIEIRDSMEDELQGTLAGDSRA